ncbi:DUF6867 family protein [Zavarzinia sp. CC-PAN008]|uniref:DUF6867 family protein n=1 Tax=Zavarzinia sp. CC-PAN008 TaxID=3243332 RepID=UPI003F74A4DE
MEIAALYGGGPGSFIGLTLVLFGLCAWLSGEAIATSWMHGGTAFLAGLGLGPPDWFLHFALFGADLAYWPGMLAHAVVLGLIAVTSHRVARTALMVRQYPWAYERAGPFAWRARQGSGGETGSTEGAERI